MKTLLFFTFLTAFSANTFAGDGSRPNHTQIRNGVRFSTLRAVELNEDFSNLEEVKGQLDSFKIKALTDKPLLEDSIFKCFTSKKNDRVVEVSMLAGSRSAEVSVTTLEDQDNDFKCTLSTKEKEISFAFFSLLPSLLVEGQKNFNEQFIKLSIGTLKLDRIILLQGSTLLFKDMTATITVNEIYSIDGSFKTYNSKSQEDGRSGGVLQMDVKKSFGKLSVLMMGTDGENRQEVPSEMTWKKPGGGLFETAEVVIPFAAPGVKPRDGLKGKTGYAGSNGGNSGSLKYTTEMTSDDFVFTLNSEAGRGGKGGAGGMGSVGEISTTKGMADGGRGPVGDVGVDGAPGKLMNSCFQSNDSDSICGTKI